MTAVRNPIRRLALAILLALGVLTTSMPQAQAAPGGVLCTATENDSPTVTHMSMACNGVGELVGSWALVLEPDGSVSGSSSNGGTLEGNYTSTCTIFISVAVTVCHTIFAEVCVDSTCVSVTIVICFTKTVTVCVRTYSTTEGLGTGTYTS